MAKRYDQYCPMAHALSLVGERWSLLIVRELLRGPKRYTDISGGLPGIPTNILAARLKDLEAGGIVEKKKIPPPAACTVYELTEYGAGLEEALYALARWGARSLGPPTKADDLYDDWGLNALPAVFNREEARGPDRDLCLQDRRRRLHGAGRRRRARSRRSARPTTPISSSRRTPRRSSCSAQGSSSLGPRSRRGASP